METRHDHMVDAMRYAFEARASHDPHYHTFRAKFQRVKRRVFRYLRGLYHTAFWRTMFFLGIGWTVGKVMCRLGIYGKMSLTGACQFCGNKH